MKNKHTLLLGLLPLSGSCENDVAKPNIIFIIADDLKPAIKSFGDPYAITPNIDELVSNSTTYTRAYCQQALSGPSRASLLTGLRPEEVGVTELNTWIREKDGNIKTLPQHFKEYGYETRSIGKTFHGEKNTLDSLSWSKKPVLYNYTKNDEYILSKNKTGKKAVSYEFTDSLETEYLDIRIKEEAIRQLNELAESKKPFLLAIGFLKPHLPFCAPRRFSS